VAASLPEGSASIHWIPTDGAAFEHLAAWTNGTRMHYGRLLIASILPPEVERALYLDADILVLGDISPLWEIDLEGAAVGAVIDAGVDALMKNDQLGRWNIPRVLDYFNSGVLLIDLERWRDQRIAEKVLEYVARNPTSLFPDQNALNVVCDGHWKQLDLRWNFQRHMEHRLADMSPANRPAIVHFVTGEKPWNAAIPNANATFYDSIRARTCFRRTATMRLCDVLRRNGSGIKRAVKRFLPLPKQPC
jgi:lipopolysaccharide biosynthesis glycosyltransferase